MLKRLIAFALAQRLFVIVLTVLIAVAGVVAFQDLPIEAFPDVQDTQVQVITAAPGQAPEEVERTLSQPIEQELVGVPRLTQIRSVSMSGLSVVTLTFSDGTDDYFARAQTLEKLQGVNLPSGVQPSLAPLTTAVGEVLRYVIDAPPDMPRSEVRALQDWVIRPALRQVSGVADVVTIGGAIREYQVRLDPALLRKHQISADQVVAAVGAGSGNAGGGTLRHGEENLVIRTLGLFRSTDDIASATITTRNGQPIQVRDVARVEIGERTRSGIAAFDGRDDVIEGIVDITKGGDPSKVVVALRERMAAVQAKLPSGVKLHVVYDRTDLVRHTVHTVAENLTVGAALVLAVLVVFMRNVVVALIVATVIPLALLVAFLLMRLKGVPANLISLGAIDFGIIVDSAVVLAEAVIVRLSLLATQSPPADDLRHRMTSLRDTTVELGRPILFSKAIIVLAFLPIFTFQRVEGKIFSPMTLTLSFALSAAVIFTLTLIPALLSFPAARGGLHEHVPRWLEWLQERYRAGVAGTLRQPGWIAGVAALCLVGAGLVVTRLGSEFLPKLDEGNIWLTIDLPVATALDKSKEIERQVRAILSATPEVNTVLTQVGRPDDGTDPKGPNNIEIMADLKPRSEWRYASKEELVAALSERIHQLPGVPTNFSQVIEDNVEESLSGVKGEIAVKVFGPDLDILEAKGEQVARILNGIRGAADVEVIKIGGQAELDVQLDRAAMARYGLNPNDVNTSLQTALAGTGASVFYEGSRRFDVTVRLDERFRDAPDRIADMPVTLPAGNNGSAGDTIALGRIAHIAMRQGAARIARESGSRIVSVKANLLGRDQGSFVQEAMQRVAQEVVLPEGYRLSWGGQFENQQRALRQLAIIVPLSAVAIYVLLFWAFKSTRRALLVLAMVPLTLVGGIVALALAGLHLSISAAVGCIAVSGIALQNGVIMVEHYLERLRDGLNMQQAVLEGSLSRLRPIVMTALMAGLGLLPAALSHGIGSETQRPFALVIVGGMVSGTFFVLMLLPWLFMKFGGREEA